MVIVNTWVVHRTNVPGNDAEYQASEVSGSVQEQGDKLAAEPAKELLGGISASVSLNEWWNQALHIWAAKTQQDSYIPWQTNSRKIQKSIHTQKSGNLDIREPGNSDT